MKEGGYNEKMTEFKQFTERLLKTSGLHWVLKTKFEQFKAEQWDCNKMDGHFKIAEGNTLTRR